MHILSASFSKNREQGKLEIAYAQQPSHTYDLNDLEDLLESARNGDWRRDPEIGKALGRRLFQMLNGSGGILSRELDKAYQGGYPLLLQLETRPFLDVLPFELLHDRAFLVFQGNAHPGQAVSLHILRKVCPRNARKISVPENRPLKVLFMASSPWDLPQDEVLQYENEEDQIQKFTHASPLDLVIEDSGSLQGLSESLNEVFDIVHLTGHAGLDPGLGPVLYLEDEFGKTQGVGVEKLWEDALRLFPPGLLFLSGCDTGKGDKVHDKPSFAYSMVEKAVPFVLAWGHPVSDRGATLFAASLYRYLSIGKGLLEAVNLARWDIRDHYHTWSLVQLYADGTAPHAFTATGQKRKPSAVKLLHKHLESTQVKVLESGFIGRRRPLQSGLAVLKGKRDGKSGLLIHGPAGIGKSCLAGKLLSRFPGSNLVVVHGELKSAKLLEVLQKIFDREGFQPGLEALNSDQEWEEKLKATLRACIQGLPLCILLDDFEQNLEPSGLNHQVSPSYLATLRALMKCLEWGQGRLQLLITSRHPFNLEIAGRNLPRELLLDIPLASFMGADLAKKQAQMEHIRKSVHSDWYWQIGQGNPRLLEWLNLLAEKENGKEDGFDPTVLAFPGEKDVRKSVAEILARTQGTGFLDFLRLAAVFRRPVPVQAFETFGPTRYLQTGSDLTLVEREDFPGEPSRFCVTPTIREAEFGNLPPELRKPTHFQALAWYEKQIGKSRIANCLDLEETIHHGLEAGETFRIIAHALKLALYYKRNLWFYDECRLLQSIADRITPEEIDQAISEKNPEIAILFHYLGQTWCTLREGRKAIRFAEQSLAINLKILGPGHPNVAADYFCLGTAWMDMGEGRQAIRFLEQALAIHLEAAEPGLSVLGSNYNALGQAWQTLGESRKAIGFFEQALAIHLKIPEGMDSHVAVDYNNLGQAWDSLGASKKAIGFLEQALAINLKVLGPKHPEVATNYINLGSAWKTLGEIPKAIGFFEQALAIDLNVFGPEHPNISTDYNNLGQALNTLGESQKAIRFFERALAIDLKILGPEHPNIAVDYSNLGDAWIVLGDHSKAIGFFEQALALREPEQSYTATYCDKLGRAWLATGETRKAIPLLERALEINCKALEPENPKIASNYNNIGFAWINLGESRKAIPLLEQALAIGLKALGPESLDVYAYYINLGVAWKNLGEKKKAGETLETALRTLTQFHGSGHPISHALATELKSLENNLNP